MKKQIGLYIHIPFCARKCSYCDFASFAGREGDMEAYVDRLIEEMEERAETAFEVSTLFIGGGTPSLLPPALMDRLLTAVRLHFHMLPNAECTCECNPGTLTPEFLQILKKHGINRLSFGAQAAQPRLLSLLSRIHSWEQVEESVAMAKEAGFTNINLDLMLGLPGQTKEDVTETLEKALALSPTHLSCYGLIVEEGTVMHAMTESGAWRLPDEDTERAMYETCRERLRQYGMLQYEISNFSLPGFPCNHNLDCWKRKEYLGLGSAACSFLNETRYQNPPALEDYLRKCPPERTLVSPEDARFESIMLGLRMMEGVSEENFLRMHGLSIQAAFGEKMKKPLKEGLIQWESGFLRLTRKGMDLQNMVLVEFL